jgi:hypothetical protein
LQSCFDPVAIDPQAPCSSSSSSSSLQCTQHLLAGLRCAAVARRGSLRGATSSTAATPAWVKPKP